ncbi:MAG: hypothetical protein GY719_12215 [bacterium]|nr:hypothetical protein [bacterium]
MIQHDVNPIGGTLVLYLAAALVLAGGALAQPDDPCVVEDDGSGTVVLPPPGCAYLTGAEVHMIIDGLPPPTTIELAPIHQDFICRKLGECGVPGGTFPGGEVEDFDSQVIFELNGTGDLDGFHRILAIPVAVQTHTGPRTPGDPVQTFPTDMFLLQGDLPPGDPDFAQLQIQAGTGFGLPSPGQTTLTRLGPPGSDFQVDSFFDVSYTITFFGNPAGALGEASGSTTGTLRVEAAGESDPCVVVDDGTGTVELPPPGCDYLSPQEVHMIIDGLPPGTEIELDPRHTAFLCEDPTGCGEPGGSLGGEVENFGSTLVLQLAGTNALGNFRRTLRVPGSVVTHTGPRTPSDPVQSFPTDMFSLLGTLPPGDPDFASLTITAGSGNGLPSPGHTTLTDLGDGTFNVDSFFDITYTIDFQGAPGGALEGLSGSTTSIVRVNARAGKQDSVEDDNGLGTVTMPPEGGEYVSPDEVHMIIEGLPAGTTIELDPSHWSFFCETTPCSVTGGGLGGGTELFGSTLEIELRGTGALTGFQRNLQLPATTQTDTGPQSPGAPVQEFDTEMVNLTGNLPPGDPDFAQLTILAGSANGLPSPGHTTLTDQGDGTFVVDSFFDIDYQIDFVGAPGGQLDGLSGSTQGEIRVTACDRQGPEAPAHNITIVKRSEPEDPVDVAFTGLATFSLDDDANPTLPDRRTFNNLNLGTHTVTETVPAGWSLASIDCDDPDGGTTVDLAAGEASIDLDLGEAITCTFINVEGDPAIFADGFETRDTSRWSNTQP